MSDLTSVITSAVNNAVNATNNAVNSAINAANNAINVGITQLNAALTGPSELNFAYGKVILPAPVGPGVVIDMPSNTDSQLALTNPAQFQGTINFNAVIPGVTPNGQSSLVALIGVPADHWTYARGVLTLFAGSQVTDALKMTPSAAGFGVYAAPGSVGVGLPGGVVIASPGLTAVPAGVVPLPGTIGA